MRTPQVMPGPPPPPASGSAPQAEGRGRGSSTVATHARHVARVPARVWASLHEPRVVTALVVLAYVALTVVGVVAAVAAWPVSSPMREPLLVTCTLLTVSGVVGAPAAWTGTQWVERVGTTVGMGAAIALAVTGWALAIVKAPSLTLTVGMLSTAGAVGLFAHMAVRHARVVLAPWSDRSRTPGARRAAATHAQGRVLVALAQEPPASGPADSRRAG